MTRKVNFDRVLVRQQDQADCGIACLSTIVRFHGGETSIESLRDLSGTTKSGTSLLGLRMAARELGFDADGFELDDMGNLSAVKHPAILLVTRQNAPHYVVSFEYKNGKVRIGDPACGVVQYSMNEFELLWKDRFFLQLTPNSGFDFRCKRPGNGFSLISKLLRDDFTLLLTSLMLGITIAGIGFSTAIFSQRLIDDILPSGNKMKLGLSLILVMMLLCARAGVSYLRGLLMVSQSRTFNNRIVDYFYSSLIRLPKSFFDSRKTGDFVARIGDTSRIQAAVSVVFGNALIDAIVLLLSCLFTTFYSFTISALVITAIPCYLVLVANRVKPIVRSQKEVMSSHAFCESHFIDTIQGVTVIKSFNKQSFFDRLNQKIFGSFQEQSFKLNKVVLKFGTLVEVIGIVFTVSMFGLCSVMVLAKRIQMGEMVALLTVASNILPSINSLVAANVQWQEAKIALARMAEFSNNKPEWMDGDEESELKHFEWHSLNVRDVSFSFPGRCMLLKGISFEMSRKEMIAILGESGSGKSSIFQILQRFYNAQTGEILVNGRDWAEISTASWRNSVGYVPQDIKILNGTILYNICLNDSRHDLRRVMMLSKRLGLDKFFEGLPQQYLTSVGEEGINLSGGQKQLVALTRALYNRPQLLLLDEATAAMDTELEDFILKKLQELKKEMGIIVITHRMRIARKCDKIFVLRDGSLNRLND